jgi:hypothetical protein
VLGWRLSMRVIPLAMKEVCWYSRKPTSTHVMDASMNIANCRSGGEKEGGGKSRRAGGEEGGGGGGRRGLGEEWTMDTSY